MVSWHISPIPKETKWDFTQGNKNTNQAAGNLPPSPATI